MTPLQFDDWIAALRRNGERQTKHTLETHDGHYCALGLLLRRDRWTRGLRRVASPEGVYYDYRGARMVHGVVTAYREAIDLREDYMNEIMNWNDVHDVTFEQMADKMEKMRHGFTRPRTA